MNVFISWSGGLSLSVAEKLGQWLRRTIPVLQPFVSTQDIAKNEMWLVRLLTELNDSAAGVICVTRENMHSDWLLFEAGALARHLPSSNVCTLLIDVGVTELGLPLSAFQSTVPTKDDVRRLLKTIHSVVEPPLHSESELEEQFSAWWPDLDSHIQQALAIPVQPRTELQQLTEELLLPVIYREANSGNLQTIFEWLHIAKQRRVADLEGCLGFVEACLARVTGKRGAQQSLRQLSAKRSEFAGAAYLEWLFVQFAGNRRLAEIGLQWALLESAADNVRRTAYALVGLWHLREESTDDARQCLALASPERIGSDAHDDYRALALGILCFAFGESALGERHFDVAKSPHPIPSEGYPFISLVRDFDRAFVVSCIGYGERPLANSRIREFRGYAWVLARYAEIFRQCAPALESLIDRSQSWQRPLSHKGVSDRLLQFQKRLIASSGAPMLS